MKCIKCGAEISEGNLYCAECGEEIHIVPDFEPEVEIQIDETMNQIMDEMAGQSGNDAKKCRKKKKHHYLIWVIMIAVIGLMACSMALWYLYTSAEYKINRANYYADQGEYYTAIEYYESAIEIEEDNIEVYWYIARCYDLLNHFERYEEYLFKIIDSEFASEDDILLAYTKIISLYSEKNDFQTIDSLLKDCNNVNVMNLYGHYMVSEPKFSHEAGFYKEIIPLKITTEENETVYYTMDGNVPTTDSETYITPIFLESGEYTIKAISVNEYGVVSKVITKEYQIEF